VSGVALRLELHAFAAGQLIALGVASYLLVRLWERFGPERRWVGLVAVGLGSAALCWFVMRDDLSNFVAGRPGGELLWRGIFAAGYGLGVVAATVIARWLSGKLGYITGVFAGALLTAVNHFHVLIDYEGLHFLTGWLGAVVIGTALVGVAVPTTPDKLSKGRWGLVGITAITAVVSFVVRPSERVWGSLFVNPGAIVAPVAARWRSLIESNDAEASSEVNLAPPSEAEPAPPSGLGRGDERGTVLLITIDAVRRDLIEKEKYRDTLPTLWSLAGEGVVFRNARSPTPATATTYQAMMTSRYHSQLYLTTKTSGEYEGAIAPFEDDSPRLPAELQKGGVTTLHGACLHRLVEGATGIGGFDKEVTTKSNFGRAAQLTEIILELLRESEDRPKTFLYAHYVDPHAPYNRGSKKGSSFERYLAEIAVVDQELAKIRAYLDESGRWKDTLFIVSADHGEAFGEHGRRYHASTVYEEMIDVPLIMVSPLLRHREVDTPVSLIDMGPTILDWFGLVTPASFMGQSLVPLMRGKPIELSRPLVIDSGRRMQAMIFRDGMKALRDLRRGTRELYDLKDDPEEKKNLIDVAPDAAERQATLAEFFKIHTQKREGYEVPWRKF
jgi:arylsulfatase A-like enzyme